MAIFSGRWFFFMLLLVSCSEMDEASIEPGTDYQPLGLGDFWEYKVVETLYFGESDVETSQFFFRDTITSHYFNEMDEQVYLFQRYKSIDRQNWKVEKTFTYKISKGALIRTVDNLSTVCLVFPPTQGESWNGNVYNAEPEDAFVLDMLENYQLEGGNYQQAAKVIQNEEDDLITLRDQRFEVYVKGVGLVESYYEVLSYCSRNDCLGEQIVESGRFVHLELIRNG